MDLIPTPKNPTWVSPIDLIDEELLEEDEAEFEMETKKIFTPEREIIVPGMDSKEDEDDDEEEQEMYADEGEDGDEYNDDIQFTEDLSGMA